MVVFNLPKRTPKMPGMPAVIAWSAKYWFHLIVLVFVVHIYRSKDIRVVVSANEQTSTALVSQLTKTTVKNLPPEPAKRTQFSLIPETPAEIPQKTWSASDFSNLTFILNPDLAIRKGVGEDIVLEKLNNCRNYVKRFAKSAIREMQVYGIPASITLAQGLLESDAGDSRLARESNNHFGIKCRAKCRGCTCRNYSDDDIYDMFRVFDTAWDSFREHSILLQISRYNHLKKWGTKDYRNWAVGLKKAGYATDKNYHKKLIRIIEELDLHQFDN